MPDFPLDIIKAIVPHLELPPHRPGVHLSQERLDVLHSLRLVSSTWYDAVDNDVKEVVGTSAPRDSFGRLVGDTIDPDENDAETKAVLGGRVVVAEGRYSRTAQELLTVSNHTKEFRLRKADLPRHGLAFEHFANLSHLWLSGVRVPFFDEAPVFPHLTTLILHAVHFVELPWDGEPGLTWLLTPTTLPSLRVLVHDPIDEWADRFLLSSGLPERLDVLHLPSVTLLYDVQDNYPLLRRCSASPFLYSTEIEYLEAAADAEIIPNHLHIRPSPYYRVKGKTTVALSDSQVRLIANQVGYFARQVDRGHLALQTLSLPLNIVSGTTTVPEPIIRARERLVDACEEAGVVIINVENYNGDHESFEVVHEFWDWVKAKKAETAAMPGKHKARKAEAQGKQPYNKRGAPPAAEAVDVPADPAEQERSLKTYLHHAVKLLNKAVKKSKTFELQKLTRKLKQTREPKDGAAVDAALVADLEAQLLAIKNLNLDAVPAHLLTTRLAKLPVLRSAPFLPSLLSSFPSTSKAKFADLDPQSAEGKARNRVLANKTVGEAWDEVSRAVRRRMGEEVDSKGKDKGKGKEKEPEKKRGMTMDPGRAAALEAALLKGGEDNDEEGAQSSEDEGPAAGFSDDEEGAGSGDEDDDEAIERELAALNDGVGSEGEWSGSEDEDAGSDDDAASTSSFPSRPSKKRQPSLSPSPPPAKKAKSALKPGKPITSSSFLPSLAAGYVSYSDSDGEDAKWVKDAEREDKKGQRKNRRGQRARQAIWEKKFGSAANHVVKAVGGKPVPMSKIKEHKAKRAASGGANGASSDRPARPPRPERDPNEPFNPLHSRGGSTNPNAQSLGANQRSFGGGFRTGGAGGAGPAATGGAALAPAVAAAAPSGEKMHPSWEAKRKQKEAMLAIGSAPQGKKVVFD
ncbi:hypothetical protein JCM8097_005672 [Rhodosporidiobolus ruineniae]